MPFCINGEVSLYYEDYGQGNPIILIHGWPLSGKAWESIVPTLIENGYRCIIYDRRGFGDSSRPYGTFDYDTLASDLKSIIDILNLENVVVIGFSMGGGEVVRYCTRYKCNKIKAAVLLGSIIPGLLQSEHNPSGIPKEIMEGIIHEVTTNRVAFLDGFFRTFYNVDDSRIKLSKAELAYDFNIASNASPRATIECAKSWAYTDFTQELGNVTIPTLILHGDEDHIVPITATSARATVGIPNNEFYIIKGAPHGLCLTHKEEVLKHLLLFLEKYN